MSIIHQGPKIIKKIYWEIIYWPWWCSGGKIACLAFRRPRFRSRSWWIGRVCNLLRNLALLGCSNKLVWLNLSAAGVATNTVTSFPGNLVSTSNDDNSKFWIFAFDFSTRRFVDENVDVKEATVRLKWRPSVGRNVAQGSFRVKIYDLIKMGHHAG